MEEPMLKLRAKGYMMVHGVQKTPGEEFELPEREALQAVGNGVAEQIDPEKAGKEEHVPDNPLQHPPESSKKPEQPLQPEQLHHDPSGKPQEEPKKKEAKHDDRSSSRER